MTTNENTRAEEFAEYFGNDGQRFDMQDGTTFSEKMGAMGVVPEYSRRVYLGSGELDYESGYESDLAFGDPIRWVFSDGSCIVSAGDAWDFEGDELFSWRG